MKKYQENILKKHPPPKIAILGGSATTVLFFKWIVIFVDLHFWKQALFSTKCWNFILLQRQARLVSIHCKWLKVWPSHEVFIHSHCRWEKWNSKAYLSYRQYGEILRVFQNELQFTFGKFWGAFTCSTVLKTQDYDQMKLLFNRECHEKI